MKYDNRVYSVEHQIVSISRLWLRLAVRGKIIIVVIKLPKLGIGDFMDKKMQIKNSTVDFLVFTKQNGEDGIEVRIHDEDVWLTQKSMAQLFDCSTDNISLHLKNIFASGELSAEAVTEKSSATASDGKKYMMKFYNLDAIISVGYRINSIRATQFRQWATKVLKTFAVQGYVLDKKRLENGQIFDEEYFEHLLDEIREIRASERKFYQKITDIYATAVDYSPTAATSKVFFAMVQNKLYMQFINIRQLN